MSIIYKENFQNFCAGDFTGPKTTQNG